MTRSLVPAMIEAPGEPQGRLPFGFARRFLVFLSMGLVWLVPAWWYPHLIVGLLLWDLIGLVAWLYDLRRLPAPRELQARRVLAIGNQLREGYGGEGQHQQRPVSRITKQQQRDRHRRHEAHGKHDQRPAREAKEPCRDALGAVV